MQLQAVTAENTRLQAQITRLQKVSSTEKLAMQDSAKETMQAHLIISSELFLALSQEIQGHELAASQARLREKEAEEALDAGLQELKQASIPRLETHMTLSCSTVLFPPPSAA